MIERQIFILAFGRDVDYHEPYPFSTYLNLTNGDIKWIWKEDKDAEWEGGITEDENKANRELILSSQEQYLEVPGLKHGDHHKILQEFFNSNWTGDYNKKQEARSAYYGSIGAWLKSIEDEEIKYAYNEFKYNMYIQLGEEFLRKHGIKPVWR